jgi:hypothetical protein
MNRNVWKAFAGVCALAVAALWSVPAGAQSSDVKEKPPMYSYVGNWNIPRAQWGEMEKSTLADQKILEKALASGTIIGYGNDVELVHQPDGGTHDDWWSSMSMAGLLNVLEQFYKSGNPTSPVLASATKHWDTIYVSRYYNWHSGSWTGAYTRVAVFRLKPDAPNDALDTLSKNVFVPLLEKLLADGALHEYEIDTEAIHTQSPSNFLVVVIAANGEGLDKYNAAVRDMAKASPLVSPALASMVDFNPHRDDLVRTTATYK